MQHLMMLVFFMGQNKAMFEDAASKQMINCFFKAILHLLVKIEFDRKTATTDINPKNAALSEMTARTVNVEHIASVTLPLLEALFYHYSRCQEQHLLGHVRMDEPDLFVIYYLVRLLEDVSKYEQLVLITLRIIQIPMAFALKP